jgi:hypothetical protein
MRVGISGRRANTNGEGKRIQDGKQRKTPGRARTEAVYLLFVLGAGVPAKDHQLIFSRELNLAFDRTCASWACAKTDVGINVRTPRT